jgi:hypothetical protein
VLTAGCLLFFGRETRPTIVGARSFNDAGGGWLQNVGNKLELNLLLQLLLVCFVSVSPVVIFQMLNRELHFLPLTDFRTQIAEYRRAKAGLLGFEARYWMREWWLLCFDAFDAFGAFDVLMLLMRLMLLMF